ncbi:MAG TPA: DUF4214 domain-containing protein, partial [Pirellulales bacterium]|nr:DUF4214 domain-containing protein [Pirellulales bacterium]
TTFSSSAVATFTESNVTLPASDYTATINWGDGTSSTSTSVTVTGSNGTLTVAGSHLYADELTSGSASVILTQTTAGSATSTATGTASAAEADTLTVTGTPVSTTATQDSTFRGTLATFATSNSNNVAGDFTATINWGDGTSSTGVAVSGSSTALTVAGSHVYTTTGTESVTVVLSDKAPGTASSPTATATITVAAAPANVVSPVGNVTISATEGATFSSTAVATFTESNVTLPAGDYTATINWGDGTSSTGVAVTGSGDGTLTVAGSHLYTDELASGSASVVLAQTSAGVATGTATGSATAAEADTLTAGTSVTTTATQGSTFSGTVATFTTSFTGNVAGDFTATIDWGDGASSTGNVSLSGGTLTVTGSHVYTAAGTETVSVVLSDDTPGTATATASATITVAAATPVPPSVGLLAGTPGDGTPQTFVKNLYRELLGREPDSVGQAYWLGVLGGNASDATVRARVVRGFLYSAEFETHFVTSLYQDFLGRAPDAAGLQFYVGILSKTHDLAEIIKFIAGAQEYFTRAGGTASGFVTALYRDLLGRDTDATSAYWVDQVGRVGRDNVVSGLLLTSEGANKFFNGDFLTLLGNAPVASPGSVQTGNYALANLTGNGWANLFFQANPPTSAVSAAVSQLQRDHGKHAIDAIVGLMSSSQFYG